MRTPKLYAIIIHDKYHNLIYWNYDLDDIFLFDRQKVRESIYNITTKIVHHIKKDSSYSFKEKVNDIDVIIYCSYYEKYIMIVTNDLYHVDTSNKLLNSLMINNNYTSLFNLYKIPFEINTLNEFKIEYDETNETTKCCNIL